MSTAGDRTVTRTLPIILALSLAFTVTVVDPLVLNLNMPQVSRALHVPPQAIGLLGGAATLTMAASVLAAGRIGDAFGLKRLLKLGLVVVTVVDLLSCLSPGYVFLLVMRFLAGLGMTALLGVPLALLKVSVAPEKRPVAIGGLMAVDVLLCGLLPAFTGWAVTAVGWRLLFLIAPLLCLVSLWLTIRYVPESEVRQGSRVDVPGIALIGLTLLTLVVGLAAAQNGVSRPQTWVPLVLSAVAVALFVRHARRVPEPALDLALFRSAPFSVALAATLTLNFLIAGLGIVLGQFGSVVLSMSPESIGLLYLPGTLLIAGAVILAGHLVGKRTPRPVMVTGLLVMAASGLLAAGTASPTVALWLLVLVTWLCNLGSVVTSASVSETVLSQAPEGRSGTVASVQMAFAVSGAAFGPTTYLLLLNHFFHRQWLADARTRGLTVAQASRAVGAVRSGLAQTPGTTVYDPNLLRQASGLNLGLDFADALRLTMLTVSVLPLVVAVLAFLLMRPRRGKPRQGTRHA
ncbi:MFS transporter [Streptomyces malaysiense]|uniref:Arabinose ABC transporter permease n=1 Tax=Streptomyces malaysiense TaxID=1428626 RepID=A0A1J4PZH6_9ACTN|nr:MFS transporter [Streptomyces malaysiense]OIK25526.1 arabinose ABC transporter permease [Streptomyces malaysiense]